MSKFLCIVIIFAVCVVFSQCSEISNDNDNENENNDDAIQRQVCDFNHPSLSKQDCVAVTQFILDGDIRGLQEFLNDFKIRQRKRLAKRWVMCMRLIRDSVVCQQWVDNASGIFSRHLKLAEFTKDLF